MRQLPSVGAVCTLYCCQDYPVLLTVPHHACAPACSILYQRGIYPPESFQVQKRYGLSLMVTSEEGLTKYLTDVLSQMSGGIYCHFSEVLFVMACAQHAALVDCSALYTLKANRCRTGCWLGGCR